MESSVNDANKGDSLASFIVKPDKLDHHWIARRSINGDKNSSSSSCPEKHRCLPVEGCNLISKLMGDNMTSEVNCDQTYVCCSMLELTEYARELPTMIPETLQIMMGKFLVTAIKEYRQSELAQKDAKGKPKKNFFVSTMFDMLKNLD